MATITQDDAQAWLERQADHYMDGGVFTSDVLPGVTWFGVRVAASTETLIMAATLEATDVVPLEFHATWLGTELTASRTPTRQGRCCH